MNVLTIKKCFQSNTLETNVELSKPLCSYLPFESLHYTGLDARAAAIVMRTVRNISNTGRSIVSSLGAVFLSDSYSVAKNCHIQSWFLCTAAESLKLSYSSLLFQERKLDMCVVVRIFCMSE